MILRSFLYNINLEVLLLAVIFVIVFGALMTVLGRTRIFGGSHAMKTIIALSVSLFAVYGLSRTRINFANIFYSFGFNQDFLYNFILIVLLAFLVLSGLVRNSHGERKWRLYRPMIIIGSIFTALALFTRIIYEKTTTLAISIPMLIIGIYLWSRSHGKKLRKRKTKRATWKDKARYKAHLKKNVEDHNRQQEHREERQEQSQERKALAQENQQEHREEKRERVQRQQRSRNAAELNKKYQSYMTAVKYIQRRNNGKIPKRGAKSIRDDGNLRHRYIQAMKAVEHLADKQGVKLRGRGKIH